jgi:arylsulfatase A-like enzyme
VSRICRHSFVLLTAASALLGCQANEDAVAPQVAASDASASPPNILLIVTDDMGYTDVGAFGSEISTPNLDRLAFNGVRLTNFHASPQCAPTRSMLMSGADNHKAGMGSMFPARFIEGDYGDRWGYEGQLHHRVATMPERLGDAGYHTYMAGKWHLGQGDELKTTASGFDTAFVLMGGAASHMTKRNVAVRPVYREDGIVVDTLPDNFYSTNTYTDKIIGQISANAGDGKPFFAYLAVTSPHWPLQVPEEYRDRYAGQYENGYDALRSRRISRAEELGVIHQVNADLYDPVGMPWDELSEAEQRYESRKMEIHAAMMENLDDNIGRVITYLEESGQLDNTFIFFMSDNGAESDRSDRRPGVVERVTGEDNFHNLDYDSLGTELSWAFIGPGWAQASTAPYQRFKGFFAEGGTRVTSFASHPTLVKGRTIDGQYLNVMDVMPTFLDIAGAEFDESMVRGREVLPMDGTSFLAALGGATEPAHPADKVFAFELHGQRALRRGDWKMVWEQEPVNIWWDDEPESHWNSWRLYNLANDPSEEFDLSKAEPELLAELAELWDAWADANDIKLSITPQYLSGPPRAAQPAE